jgi:hypothetical protein
MDVYLYVVGLHNICDGDVVLRVAEELLKEVLVFGEEAVLLVEGEGAGEAGAEVVDAVWMGVVELGVLFRYHFHGEVLKLQGQCSNFLVFGEAV